MCLGCSSEGCFIFYKYMKLQFPKIGRSELLNVAAFLTGNTRQACSLLHNR